MWLVIQIATFFAVTFSAIHYGWGDDVSGLAIGVVGVFAAFLVTAIPLAFVDMFRRFKPPLTVGGEKRINDGSSSGIEVSSNRRNHLIS